MGYTSAATGSGLGLYHVRQVLGEMNGSIEVDQDHDGKLDFITGDTGISAFSVLINTSPVCGP